jgi:hypothetical protein
LARRSLWHRSARFAEDIMESSAMTHAIKRHMTVLS